MLLRLLVTRRYIKLRVVLIDQSYYSKIATGVAEANGYRSHFMHSVIISTRIASY